MRSVPPPAGFVPIALVPKVKYVPPLETPKVSAAKMDIPPFIPKNPDVPYPPARNDPNLSPVRTAVGRAIVPLAL